MYDDTRNGSLDVTHSLLVGTMQRRDIWTINRRTYNRTGPRTRGKEVLSLRHSDVTSALLIKRSVPQVEPSKGSLARSYCPEIYASSPRDLKRAQEYNCGIVEELE